MREVQPGACVWKLLEGEWSVRSWEWASQPRLNVTSKRRPPLQLRAGWSGHLLSRSPTFQAEPFMCIQSACTFSHCPAPISSLSATEMVSLLCPSAAGGGSPLVALPWILFLYLPSSFFQSPLHLSSDIYGTPASGTELKAGLTLLPFTVHRGRRDSEDVARRPSQASERDCRAQLGQAFLEDGKQRQRA